MGFFWKFTRSGKYSHTYISLIIDAEPSCIDRSKCLWRTSFEELEMFLVLLHDVEVINNPAMGATKPAFREVVETLGYEPTLKYKQLRHQFGLVKGQDTMGRHGGIPLDWGYYANPTTPVTVDIRDLQVAGFIDAKDGKLFVGSGEDKLLCYRGYPYFQYLGFYWDLMPKHVVMNPLVRKMIQADTKRANQFLVEKLKWNLRNDAKY